MTTDYDQIRNEHIREYGEGTHHLSFLGELYSDRTHFVFELLQNAEDANATRAEFVLHEDRIEFLHDGREFDASDVRGICSVGQSVKRDDLTQIGRFGIGFKSVYAYTLHPQIHSGDEHFCIEHYVRPRSCVAAKIKANETLFVFPFDRPEVEAAVAYEEVSNRLLNIDQRVLLFLRHLKEIKWRIDGEIVQSGSLLRETDPGPSSRIVTICDVNAKVIQEWLIFDREIVPPDGKQIPGLCVEAAFKLAQDDDGLKFIQPLGQSHLVAFFPTEKETHLGFLLQGPYRTTPARDNIPQHNDWNKFLISETTQLVRDVLNELREMNLLTVDVLDSLPIWAMDFPKDGMFRMLFDGVQAHLLQNELLPASDGGFVAGHSAKLANSASMRELLSEEQLSTLFNQGEPAKWITSEITGDTRPRLKTYFRANLAIEEIDAETLAKTITDDFLAEQTDEWLMKLYVFLEGHKAVLRKQSPSFLPKAFIRLTDGSMVQPFQSNGSPNAFLPNESITGFPTIKQSLVTEPKAISMFKGIGLIEPDVFADIYKNVLPKYASKSSVNVDEHKQHVRKVIQGLQSGPYEKRAQLQAELKLISFFLARNGIGSLTYAQPGRIYLPHDGIELYFRNNKDALILSEDSEIISSMTVIEWSALGVRLYPKRISKACDLPDKERIALRDGERAISDHESKDYDLDGLSSCITSQQNEFEKTENSDRANAIWSLLCKQLEHLSKDDRLLFFYGEYRWSSGRHKKGPKPFPASFLKLLQNEAWLPGPDGKLHKPSDLALSDLPADFEPMELLATELRMIPSHLTQLAQQTGIQPDILQFVKDYQKEIESFKRDFLKKVSKAGRGSVSDYKTEIKKMFTRDQGNSVDGLEPGGDGERPQVANPERRREKVSSAIQNAIDDSRTSSQRVEYRVKKEWDEKDAQTKHFLYEQYHGRCQICDFTFPKRSGELYFEGVYLVPYTAADWVDRPGNLLCLCANCAAMFAYGTVMAADIIEQVEQFKTAKEGGRGEPQLTLTICEKAAVIKFSEKHLLELQEMIRAAGPVLTKKQE